MSENALVREAHSQFFLFVSIITWVKKWSCYLLRMKYNLFPNFQRFLKLPKFVFSLYKWNWNGKYIHVNLNKSKKQVCSLSYGCITCCHLKRFYTQHSFIIVSALLKFYLLSNVSVIRIINKILKRSTYDF